VTSVPAQSLEIDHRVGFVRPGYDADLVVWDSHPLSIGATALQVYIDGKATLDSKKVTESHPKTFAEKQPNNDAPKQRKLVSSDLRNLCDNIQSSEKKLIITGIRESYLDHAADLGSTKNLTMVVENGKMICFGDSEKCVFSIGKGIVINLENGYVLPGLTAVSVSLGLIEIPSEDRTTDGTVGTQASSLEAQNIVYAKYGVHLDGKNFKRARIGGITKAISAPIAHGFSGGVSVGIKTKEQKILSLDDGIFQDEVALHFQIGQTSKGSSAVKNWRNSADWSFQLPILYQPFPRQSKSYVIY
jgi:imidazolonepropionase-like amidohydrolase